MTVVITVRLLPKHRRPRARITLARTVRWLPPADARRARAVHEAVTACRTSWWRGQLDCKDRAAATVLAVALTGRRCRLVHGARTLPAAFHSWVETVDGTRIGADEDNGGDHLWTAVHRT
ncbi:lasso peptide biosynthesis B2 protein [Streptomyces jumonjinensis]|uniref:Lasso peptide biosynthesis B2 protein n=2 Tax=Streptomyces jumonjinensis TaxID=1945 RepID=A0A646KPD4_STRJU|nr:lasso peptide biosynthesis B2 protein [Streptomyces jumonjinensis]